jgi:hypothetical protein
MPQWLMTLKINEQEQRGQRRRRRRRKQGVLKRCEA